MDLRPKCKTGNYKLVEENTGSTLFHISCGNIFLDQSLETKETKAKVNKWDLIEIKNFCSEKDNMKFVKTQFCEMYKDLCIVKCFVFNPQHLYQIKKKAFCQEFPGKL